jgi:hypothetical protein
MFATRRLKNRGIGKRQLFTQLEENDLKKPADHPCIESSDLSQNIVARLRREGFVHVKGPEMRKYLEKDGDLSDWPLFAASWSGMPVDRYMADGGTYRRRRYSVFATCTESGGFTLQPPRPHFQTVTCNASNGGLNRWYEPFSKEIVKGASLKTILDAGRHFVEQLCSNRTWHIEAHQFRIEVFADEVGKPTPEGVHRDGVGFVLVMMINRTNVLDGETTIYPNSNGDALAHFTLLQPFDVLLLADSEVRHNVNPIVARDPARPGMRDVLVVTFSTTQR